MDTSERKNTQTISSHPPPGTSNDTLDRNIEQVAKMRERHQRERTFSSRIAEALGEFFGSIASIYLHMFLLISWIVINLDLTPITPFDPPPFSYLNVITCVEAIFLSMFVLIRQRRTMRASEKRSELDLQMSLLTEDEVTKLIRLTDLIAKKLGIDGEREVADLSQLKKAVNPAEVVERMEQSFEAEQ